MRWFELAMPGVYILAGLLLLITDVALDYIPNLRTPIAVVLIGYGSFRGWRTWCGHKERP
jgi:hypothetical protein